MSNITNKKNNDTSVGFLWKDRYNKFHRPEDMSTSHLFFTLKMIWNHKVPEDLQIKPFKLHKFSEYYTKKYMLDAVYFLSIELACRDDLTPYFKKCLDIIKGNVNIYFGTKLISEEGCDV